MAACGAVTEISGIVAAFDHGLSKPTGPIDEPANTRIVQRDNSCSQDRAAAITTGSGMPSPNRNAYSQAKSLRGQPIFGLFDAVKGYTPESGQRVYDLQEMFTYTMHADQRACLHKGRNLGCRLF
jgi:hypothetical protein